MAIPETRRDAASPLNDALRRNEVLAAGIISGVAGGFAMLAVGAIGASVQGLGPLHPLRVIGESFVGPGAFGGGVRVSFGALVHVLTSAAWGVVFAAITPREFRTTCAMGLGAGIALLAMGVMMSAVVPWANPGFPVAFQPIGGSWVIAHAVFGVTLGFAPSLRRWASGETGEVTSGGELVPQPAAPAVPGAPAA